MVFKQFDTTQKFAFFLEQILKGLSSDNYEVGKRLPTKANLAQMMEAGRQSSTGDYHGKCVIVYGGGNETRKISRIHMSISRALQEKSGSTLFNAIGNHFKHLAGEGKLKKEPTYWYIDL